MQVPRGYKVRLALVQPTTRAQPAGRRLAVITRASLPSLTTASARKKSAEDDVEAELKLLIKPLVAGRLKDHRTYELPNDRKCQCVSDERGPTRKRAQRGAARRLVGCGVRW